MIPGKENRGLIDKDPRKISFLLDLLSQCLDLCLPYVKGNFTIALSQLGKEGSLVMESSNDEAMK